MRIVAILALVMTTSLLAACGGGSDEIPEDATPPPASSEQTVVAKSFKFETRAFSVPAGREVSLTLDNEDAGTMHNISIYTDSSANQKVFSGELFSGKKSMTYTFDAPPPGRYFFRCDAHPDMRGAFYSVAP